MFAFPPATRLSSATLAPSAAFIIASCGLCGGRPCRTLGRRAQPRFCRFFSLCRSSIFFLLSFICFLLLLLLSWFSPFLFSSVFVFFFFIFSYFFHIFCCFFFCLFFFASSDFLISFCLNASSRFNSPPKKCFIIIVSTALNFLDYCLFIFSLMPPFLPIYFSQYKLITSLSIFRNSIIFVYKAEITLTLAVTLIFPFSSLKVSSNHFHLHLFCYFSFVSLFIRAGKSNM